MENPRKPLSMARTEFKTKLIDAVNTSNLPAFVLEDVIKGIYEEVKALSLKQCREDADKYFAALDEKRKEANSDGNSDSE
jgi:hypothetical protein